MNQLVLGPLNGIFIATYACPVGEMGNDFVGYFKLFSKRPACFCERGQITEGGTITRYHVPQHALRAAEEMARATIEHAAARGVGA